MPQIDLVERVGVLRQLVGAVEGLVAALPGVEGLGLLEAVDGAAFGGRVGVEQGALDVVAGATSALQAASGQARATGGVARGRIRPARKSAALSSASPTATFCRGVSAASGNARGCVAGRQVERRAEAAATATSNAAPRGFKTRWRGPGASARKLSGGESEPERRPVARPPA
ncbi:MAG: hypothetical protein H6704_07375 [Myxococcales bacterium]|nr:hypothetical protein [Myxococcales bacterium]